MGIFEMLMGEQPGIIKTFKTIRAYEKEDQITPEQITGKLGEFVIEYALTNNNIAGELVVLKNIYVPSKGTTTEIDLLMIHEKGIFVFESKNYDGWIFGNEDQLNWTQCLQNGVKNKFYNPIRQNRTHIKALADYLGMPESEFTSYIVFSERCELKKVPNDTAEVIIVRRPYMLRKLRITLNSSPIKYTREEMGAMVAKLKPLIDKNDSEKQQHIENIQTKCPFCGNDLILRKGKYGQFWGCSTYPKCRFTRPDK